MKGNLFLNLEAQKNSKNKPEFLNVNFLDTFCICSRKNEGKWCVCFNASYFKYFWYSLCRKLTKSLALHDFGEIFADAPRFCSFFGRVKSPGFSFSYAKPRKEARFVKNCLLLNVWTSSKLLDLILLRNIKRLHVMSCLK